MIREKVDLIDRIDIVNNYGVNLEEAIIYIAGELDAIVNLTLRTKIDMIKEYYKSQKRELSEINFFVNSPGGDVIAIFSLMDLYDSLLKEGIKVNVLAEGVCFSATTFLVACATGKRRASKNTRFLVHEMQISGINGTHTQTKSFQKEIGFLNERMLSVYAECTSKKKGKTLLSKEYDKFYRDWERKCQGETYLSSEEVLELGLIDEIV